MDNLEHMLIFQEIMLLKNTKFLEKKKKDLKRKYALHVQRVTIQHFERFKMEMREVNRGGGEGETVNVNSNMASINHF